ncbi:hypothetical protein GGS23DRAFT_603329 [Durotheca rogersii]|uniref:uncharacterized protein n=1 Tax=Durotheca rogersii TaxID=419775 RepID=UPI00221F86C9|nr:uncharacterized protein GGS23DRAFT_603329 [Durotheca rogersii]KAI5865812.1 hypothetical protein GGS23DRAFT_603329 [Durotheca rogersii]
MATGLQVRPAFVVEANRLRVAGGGVTEVGGKLHPRILRRWTDFPQIHRDRFATLAQTLAGQRRFPSVLEVWAIKRTLPATPLRSELDVAGFIYSFNENPAALIANAYLIPGGQVTTRMEFRFSYNAYGRLNSRPSSQSPAREESSSYPRDANPDRWGMHQFPDGSEEAVIIGEYKAAHKVRRSTFRQVLDGSFSESLFLDVVQHIKSGRAVKEQRSDPSHENVPGQVTPDEASDPDEILVAKVLCQTFHYMIRVGVRYGYVTSGELLILFHIRYDEPDVLYFHLANVPSATQEQPWGEEEARESTAAQMATVICLAMSEEPFDTDWISRATKNLPRWPLPPRKNASSDSRSNSPARRRRDKDDDDDDEGDDSGFNRRPSKLRSRLGLTVQYPNSDSADASIASEETNLPQSGQTTQRAVSSWLPNPVRRPTLKYCTQACLRGLANQSKLDPGCPNMRLHRGIGSGDGHRISSAKLCTLVQQQLAKNLSDRCESLLKFGMFGAVGTLFKLSLDGYGYTFVAKGVTSRQRGTLEHEATIYHHCRRLQGTVIPVYLGIITLERAYPLPNLSVVKHMMLLSWGGTSLKDAPDGIDLEREADRTMDELYYAGVTDEDYRGPNFVWNEEAGRIMRVDFNMSGLIRLYFPCRLGG